MEGQDGKRPPAGPAPQQAPQAPQPLGGVVVAMMETSLVQEEESMDESNDASVQEDLQVTLQEKIEMRKNLESTFDCQTLSSTLSTFPNSSGNNHNNNNHMPRSLVSGGTQSSGLSIQEKIFHFEQKVAANRSTTAAPPPGRPPLGPLMEAGVHGEAVAMSKKVPSSNNKRLKVFLRLRPVQDGGPSTIQVLPPTTLSTTLHPQQMHPHAHQYHHDSSYPTKIRTHPPKTSNAAKVDRSLVQRFGGGGGGGSGVMGTTSDGTAASSFSDAQVKEYEFTRVFGPEAPQQDVYTHTAWPMVQQLCSGNTIGKSALLFCYGITNAGKTHTILGDPKHNNCNNNDSWGIVPRSLDGVLKKVHHTDLQVYVSFLEVYNEHIFDLLPHAVVVPQQQQHGLKRVGSSSSLAASSAVVSNTVGGVAATTAAAVHADRHTSLKIRERHGQIVVQGLAHHRVTSLEQGLALIRQAKVGRHTATNNLNQKSSRSHCVCRLTVKKPSGDDNHNNNNHDDDDACSVGSYRSHGTSHTGAGKSSSGDNTNNEAHFWIVDLAGSERSKRTNMGRIRQQEAACINKSLMTLMRCLTNHNNKPYRDSKLTVLFMRHWNTIGSQTSMIVNAHASVQDYDETQHVLGYAVSVKVVPTITTTTTSAASNMAAAVAAPRVEYGYDGHRKKVGKQRSTIRKVAKILRKLSPVPQRHKRKNDVVVLPNTIAPPAVQLPMAPPQPFGRSLLLEQDQHPYPIAKKIRSSPDTTRGKVTSAPHQEQQGGQFNAVSSAQYNRELTSLQMSLSEARAKIQVLTSKVTGLEQQVEATETQVRAEVAEEMLNEMTAMRQRYEETISRLKELKKNHARPSVVQRNQARVEELQEKVEELQEDMERMAHHHDEELVSMQHEHAETLLLKDQEIGALQSRLAELEQQQHEQSLAAAAEAAAAATRTTTNGGDDNDVESLQQQLAASRDEVRRLQRSKEELIATYEQLLAGDDEEDGDGHEDDDGDDNDDDRENDEEEEEVESDPTPKVERTTHRETLVQKTMTTRSGANYASTRNDDTDASEAVDEDDDEEEEEEEEANEPTPKVERNKNIVKKKYQQEDDDSDMNDLSEIDASPTPYLRRRQPFDPVSDNKKQAVGGSVTNKVNSSSASSSPTTGSSPTDTNKSSASSLDDTSQKATIQEQSSEMVL